MDIEVFFSDQSSDMNLMNYDQMSPIFTPVEVDNTMETEETQTSPFASPANLCIRKIPSSPLRNENHSKDSLKFARRIAKSFLQAILDGPKRVVQDFLDTGVKVLESQITLLDVKVVDEEKLSRAWLQAIRDVWNFFAKNLSCSYNKKISKVTKDVWSMVFTEEGFYKTLKDAGSSLNLKGGFTGKGFGEIAVAERLCKKVLYVLNRGLILSHMFSLRQQDDMFYENIPTVDNYLVLSMVPELYDSYNHKRGVFIDQCCQSCKVCQSKSADKSVISKIATAWDYAIAFQKSFDANWQASSFEDPFYPLNVMRFLTVLDTPMSC